MLISSHNAPEFPLAISSKQRFLLKRRISSFTRSDSLHGIAAFRHVGDSLYSGTEARIGEALGLAVYESGLPEPQFE